MAAAPASMIKPMSTRCGDCTPSATTSRTPLCRPGAASCSGRNWVRHEPLPAVWQGVRAQLRGWATAIGYAAGIGSKPSSLAARISTSHDGLFAQLPTLDRAGTLHLALRNSSAPLGCYRTCVSLHIQWTLGRFAGSSRSVLRLERDPCGAATACRSTYFRGQFSCAVGREWDRVFSRFDEPLTFGAGRAIAFFGSAATRPNGSAYSTANGGEAADEPLMTTPTWETLTAAGRRKAAGSVSLLATAVATQEARPATQAAAVPPPCPLPCMADSSPAADAIALPAGQFPRLPAPPIPLTKKALKALKGQESLQRALTAGIGRHEHHVAWLAVADSDFAHRPCKGRLRGGRVRCEGRGDAYDALRRAFTDGRELGGARDAEDARAEMCGGGGYGGLPQKPDEYVRRPAFLAFGASGELPAMRTDHGPRHHLSHSGDAALSHSAGCVSYGSLLRPSIRRCAEPYGVRLSSCRPQGRPLR